MDMCYVGAKVRENALDLRLIPPRRDNVFRKPQLSKRTSSVHVLVPHDELVYVMPSGTKKAALVLDDSILTACLQVFVVNL